MALRLPVWPTAKALEGKWGNRLTIEQRRGTLPGVGHACGEYNKLRAMHK
jgi:hypothetical protein